MSLKTDGPVLEFSHHVEKLLGGLSSALFIENDLWVACDELTSVERLSPTAEGFGRQRSFELHGPLTLPAHGRKKVDQEIDIEGMDYDGRYLWLAGSHSLKRKKVSDEPEKGEKNDRLKPDEENIDRLRKIEA